MTSHFTFFESYYESVKDLDNDIKAEFYDAIFQYAFYDKEAEITNPIVKALFTLAKPNLNRSKAKAKAGQKGGKSKAEDKQTPSKTEANGSKDKAEDKQTPSDKEKEKEKEKEIGDRSSEKGDTKGSRLDTLSDDNKRDLYSYMKEYCKDNSIDEIEIDKFKDHWIATTGAKAVKKDWKATFRNWCRSDWVKKKESSGNDIGGWQ